MLTRSGWAVLIGAGLGVGTGRLLGITELWVLAAVGLALVLVALLRVRATRLDVRVERTVSPTPLSVGVAGRVMLSITNPTARRLGPIAVIDPVEGTVGARLVVGPLAPGATQRAGYRLPTLRRGLLRLGPARVELTDPFGLARRVVPGAPETTLTVLPEVHPAPQLRLGGGRHEPLAGASNRVVTTSGVEDLVTLRPYVVGDDLRRVHWPATARTDELQVRRDEERWRGHVTVLLDVRASAFDGPTFERAVSAAAGLVVAAADAGDRVRLATGGGADSGTLDAHRAGPTLLGDLALVVQDGADRAVERAVAPAPDHRQPTTLVILTGADDVLERAASAAGFADRVVGRFLATEPAAVWEQR